MFFLSHLFPDDENIFPQGNWRRGATDDELAELIRSLIWRKPWGHGLPDGLVPLERVMSQIGG